MPHALIMDVSDETLLSTSAVFKDAGFSLDIAGSFAEGRDLLLRKLPDVLFLGESIMSTEDMPRLEQILQEEQFAGLIEIHAVLDVDDPVALERADILPISRRYPSPLDLQALEKSLQRYLSSLDGHQDRREVHESGRGLLVGESGAMHQVYRLIRKAAISDTSVLIYGESGTGKELVSRTIHELSARAEQPFVAMNSGAIPEELAESQLFGHVKGAFTGAEQAQEGFFAAAAGGTLFLDEITEMPLTLQVKLLRVLETGEYQRLGSQTLEHSDFRVVAACNRDPAEAMEEGLLREDLFYRVAQFPLQLPPLRERGDDVILLAEHFLGAEIERNVLPKQFRGETLEAMRLRDWPGNVRELRNAVAQAYMMSGEHILPEDVPHSIRSKSGAEGGEASIEQLAGQPLENVERKLILETLEQCGGNKRETAKKLGISPKTLYARLKVYEQ